MRARDERGFQHRDFLAKQLSLWATAVVELTPTLQFVDTWVSFFTADGKYSYSIKFVDALRRITYDDPLFNITSARYLVLHSVNANPGNLSPSLKRQLADVLRDPIHAPHQIFSTIFRNDKVKA